MKRLPNVLLIGAMKAGTTGVYMDLATHPDVFLAQDKEPQSLCHDDVFTKSGLDRYAARYASASDRQVVCDASTDYSKRPDYEGVAQRAVKVLPDGFKVIYLVRHPIDRIFSQHYHEFIAGLVSSDIDKEIRIRSRYIDYSSYAYQLRPWLEAIGPERIHVVRFEDYVDHRCEVLDDICSFLGLSHGSLKINLVKIYNKSEGKPVQNNFWKGISRNSLYKQILRQILPPKLRLAIYRWMLPAAPQKPNGPALETTAWLRDSLAPDVRQLSKMLGVDHPLWEDFADEKIARPADATCLAPSSIPLAEDGARANATISPY